MKTIRMAFMSAAATLAALAAAPAQALVLPAAYTSGPCGNRVQASQACSSRPNAPIAWSSFADLASQTAGLAIDMAVPGAAVFGTGLYYYVQLSSASGSLPSGPVPILVSAVGRASVGGSGGNFNHNQATATVKVFDSTLYACAGYNCPRNTPTDFVGTYSTSVRPNSSDSLIDPNVWLVEVKVTAETNTNAPSSFAHAFADPVIRIDPLWAADHPEVSLAFSANLPVPEAPTLPMLAAGLGLLLPLVRRARRGARGVAAASPAV